MNSKLFVPAKLTFSEYLRCLNFPLWTFWPAKTKKGKESNLFRDKVPTKSGKFKHLKFSENVNFSRTNSVDSILERSFASLGLVINERFHPKILRIIFINILSQKIFAYKV